ncbi:MAG: hypothetical protein J0I20_33910 [Chloroflexi bacterium]|nr:hypothetical protein [Chloroflexota bacterium]OJW05608.1 MAG: hypothetical protein BGO39_03045 [Chloroflexi bacterium 54-19]
MAIKIVKLTQESETAPAKYSGTVQTSPTLFCDFFFYFKHCRWNLELYTPGGDLDLDGYIGEGGELDDMNKTVATSIITYALATLLGDAEVVWKLRE